MRNQFAIFGVIIVAGSSGWAAEQPAETKSTSIKPPAAASPVDVSVSSSYTGASSAKFAGLKRGDSAAVSAELALRATLPLREQWQWTGGLRQENFFLDEVAGAPIPEQIHTLGVTTGVSYQINERWSISPNLGANLYRFEDISTGTIGLNGAVLALYKPSPKWSWNLGFAVNPDSDWKVLPLVGMRWAIDEHFTLDLGLPRTRLSYRWQPGLEFFTGLGMAGTTFRMDRDFATVRYQNALTTYRDIRYGFGVTARFAQRFTAELEAGASIYRRLDFTRIDEEIRFQPAPYVRATVSARF